MAKTNLEIERIDSDSLITYLPEELLIVIISYLSINDFMQLNQVNKLFNRLRYDSCWKRYFQTQYPKSFEIFEKLNEFKEKNYLLGYYQAFLFDSLPEKMLIIFWHTLYLNQDQIKDSISSLMYRTFDTTKLLSTDKAGRSFLGLAFSRSEKIGQEMLTTFLNILNLCDGCMNDRKFFELLLVELIEHKRIDVSLRGVSLLQIAFEHRQFELINKCIQAGAEINICFFKPKFTVTHTGGKTPLWLAIANNDYDLVRFLLALRANINQPVIVFETDEIYPIQQALLNTLGLTYLTDQDSLRGLTTTRHFSLDIFKLLINSGGVNFSFEVNFLDQGKVPILDWIIKVANYSKFLRESPEFTAIIKCQLSILLLERCIEKCKIFNSKKPSFLDRYYTPATLDLKFKAIVELINIFKKSEITHYQFFKKMLSKLTPEIKLALSTQPLKETMNKINEIFSNSNFIEEATKKAHFKF